MDTESFSRLAEAERRGLAAFFGRRGVPFCDREDLAQESLVLTWQLRERVQPDKARSFLYGVANRLLLAYGRKQGRQGDVLVQGLPETAMEGRPENENTALHFMDLLAREETARLRQILAELPTRQREVIESMYLKAQTEVSIADELGISRQSVRTHHHRALGRLRELLADRDAQ